MNEHLKDGSLHPAREYARTCASSEYAHVTSSNAGVGLCWKEKKIKAQPVFLLLARVGASCEPSSRSLPIMHVCCVLVYYDQ